MIFGQWNGVDNFTGMHHTNGGDLDIAQNVVVRGHSIKKVDGASVYATGLPARVPWTYRYYGRRPDGSKSYKTYCFSLGSIWRKHDSGTGVLEVKEGFNTSARPEATLVQEAGQTELIFFSGLDVPYIYNGNDDDVFVQSDITQEFVQGVWWLDRLWAFEENTSNLYYSKTRYPTNFTDSTDSTYLPIGSAKTNSYIVSIILIGDVLYVFKNDGIFYIEGRTPSRFAIRTVSDWRGLATRRGIAKVGTAIVFLQRQDFHLYEFTGTSTGFKKISRNIKLPDILNADRLKDINMVWHDELFRFGYPDLRDSQNYAERELIFPTDDLREDGSPKWSWTKGFNVDSYALMNDEVDDNNLLIGSSTTGELMIVDKSKDYGTTALEVLVRTKSQISKLGFNTEFENLNVSGAPHNMYIEFRYYTDTRDSVMFQDLLDQRGYLLKTGLGQFIPVAAQARYNDYIALKTGYNIGECIAFEFYDNTVGHGVEIYELYVSTAERGRIRSKIAGG